MTHRLIEEALKKAAVVWVAAGDQPPRALWCLAAEGALWVVTGVGEQQAPELADATTARVSLRGDHGGRIVTWPAAVSRVVPGGDEWEQIAPQLAAKRLNAPGSAEALVARWATDCVVNKLAPAGDPVEAGPSLPDDRQVAPRRDTPARRHTRRPFRLHRVRHR